MIETLKHIPKPVWILGGVSLFMDMSSELIHDILPIYLTTVLGLSVLTVGIIEGIAEATASMLKVVSGYLSDRYRKRKPLALLGYALAALTKPIFPLAETASTVIAARFADRFGKGIRGAPRDAIVADVTPPEWRDAAYGLRQSLDTVGAFLGPLLAMFFLWLWQNDLRAVLWVATIPALISVALLGFGLKEPEPVGTPKAGDRPRLSAIRTLPTAFWSLLVVTALFSMARLSEAFLVLRAQELQLTLIWIPLVMIVMSVVYSIVSYPAGVLSKRVGRRGVWMASLVSLALAEAAMAGLNGWGGFWLGVGLWGVHMGLSQGALAAAVAETAPAELRATAFGLFHFVTGIFQLAGGALAGWVWVVHGSAAMFGWGAIWSCTALLWVGFSARSIAVKL